MPQKEKLSVNIPDEHSAKVLSRLLANQILQYMKTIIYCDGVGFNSGMQR
jgi:hypothetical protein